VTRPRDHIQSIYRNRKVFHDYQIEDRLEAGIALLGSEVKSLRKGSGNLADAYVVFRDGEAWLVNAHISPYAQATHENHEPLRERKLLLSRRELRKLSAKVRERGYSLVPISMYFKGAWVKVELGLGRGKRKHDKRTALKEREDRRDMERAARER
jgi:SsrA-binding protein